MAVYHVNNNGEPGVCVAAQGNCRFGSESEHFASAEDARGSYEAKMANLTFKLSPAKIKRAAAKVTAIRAEVSELYERVKYPSPANPELVEILTRLRAADEELLRAEYPIPKDWTPRENYFGGTVFLAKGAKMGPNGSPLQITGRKPSYGDKNGPERGLYVQTSAGVNVGNGPYATVEEAANAVVNYSGRNSPGPIGWD